MSHLARFLAFATLATSLVGCGGFGAVGNGKSASQIREVGAFKKLEIAAGVHVTFTTGPRSVEVTADENLIRHIETIVRDDTLVVRLKHPVADTSGIKAAIRNDALEGLGLSGGSSFVGPATASKDFDIDASGGSSIELTNVLSTHVSANASGGSEITLTGGSSTRLSANASGGSKIISHGFVSEDAVVNVSGGSEACVACTRSLTGDASGGSTVTVSGSPQTARVNSSGGSRLIKLK